MKRFAVVQFQLARKLRFKLVLVTLLNQSESLVEMDTVCGWATALHLSNKGYEVVSHF
jgi:hypothetical protein